MKVMSREFTTTEKVLLVVLSLALLGLLYYRFVFVTTSDMMAELEGEKADVQAELDVAKTKLQKLQKIKKELGGIDIKDYPKMESYNNSKKETAFLNKVLSKASDYSISFSDITRNGDQIRRSFALQFVTKNYKAAVSTVDDLTNGKYRCLVDDINYSLGDNGDSNVDLTATFFETMVGGKEDSALPKDESKEGEGDDSTIDGI
jgi:hypothetical protein